MVRLLLLTVLVASLGAGQALSPTKKWAMTTVTSIQARVVSEAATWDAAKKKFGLVLKQHTNTFEEQYRAAMDTVNTASVEGALFYVQTEGINQADAVHCMRKTNMSYVWFLNVTLVQPNFAIAEFAENAGVVPEYGKFIAMDGGMCTPLDAKGTLSDECLSLSGLDYHANVGPFVGGEARKAHKYAAYADNYWFSYPNSCFTRKFDAKDDACRKKQPGGLCPLGVAPDGITCTYAFDILGYIRLDDLVGITSLKNSKTGRHYADRVEFCKDAKVEFDFATMASDLTFWNNPLDEKANAKRTARMLSLYNGLIQERKGDYANMKPLPSANDLSKVNPPCWKNSPLCAKATNGCRRKLTAQICEVCSSPAVDCVKPTAVDSVPPALAKAVAPPLPTDASGKTIASRNPSGAGGTAGTAANSASFVALGASLVAVVTMSLL